MGISDYEQYYQKGGIYVLPIEVFNELWGEMESWKDTCKQKENIRKKAINYIKEESWFCYKDDEEVIDRVPINKLLEILGDNNE